MKEFMFIFKGPHVEDMNMSADEFQAYMYKWIGWVNQLKADGIYIEGRPLTKSGKVITGKAPVVTDGPFTESKELVGGYFIIRAKDIDEAVRHAQGFPDFDLEGTVEIREVQEVPGED